MADDASNAALLGALEEARSHYDDDLERRLLRALADSSLIVPVQRDPATGEVGVRASVNPDGSRHLLGFTSTQELERWAKGTPIDHRVMSGRELAAVARSVQAAALWIDPASDHGGRLSSDRVDLVAAEGSLEFEHQQGATLVLRTGDEPIEVRPLGFQPSSAALDALHEAIAAGGAISGAWLLAGAGPGAADVVLVVAGDGGVEPAVLAHALRQILPSGWSGDVYPISTAELAAGDYEAVRLGLQVYP